MTDDKPSSTTPSDLSPETRTFQFPADALRAALAGEAALTDQTAPQAAGTLEAAGAPEAATNGTAAIGAEGLTGDAADSQDKPVWLQKFDAALIRMSEWLNPITIKEARQAMKSKQFVITFALLLIAAWLWSFFGVAGQYRAGGTAFGMVMFIGYLFMLGFAVTVVVPFSAYRSLAAEREDGTYELIQITSLHPRQIIGGKLCSAVLQMLVYFSALSPCIAFTYLLRGIDMPTIMLALFYLFLDSLALSILGLFLAALVRERHWQVVLSLLFVAALVIFFFMMCGMMTEIFDNDLWEFDTASFWVANAAFLSAYLSYFAFFYFAAAAQITFVSDNRSTAVRIVMAVQQILFAGWMGWLFTSGDFEPAGEVRVLSGAMILSGLHWYLMGVFLTGESPELSPRVQRGLPRSFLGRVLFTWFNPGGGSGYVFAVANVTAVALLVFCGLEFAKSISNNFDSDHYWGSVMVTSAVWSYVTLYLGLGRLVLAASRRYLRYQPASLLIQALLVVIGTAVPLIAHTMLDQYTMTYSVLEMTNPFWTIAEMTADYTPPNAEELAVAVLLPIIAVVVFLLNLPGVAAEVRYVRIATPKRVVEDESVLHPQPAPVAVASNPWDA